MRKSNAHIAPEEFRVLIAAGGTGGHVYPAIAIADALKVLQPHSTIKFVGTKTHLEWEAVPRAGYEIFSIWISGFHRRMTLKNLLFPVKLVTSLLQSMRIISKFKPHVMISCGGYAAGPVGWVAAKKKVPLFLQEQNSYPGVTNRLLAPKAKCIFTAFKEADHYFPVGKTTLAGNPTRKALTKVNKKEAYQHFAFNSDKQTLLVLGGSGGARTINEAMAKHIEKLHDELALQIIWQCGKNYVKELRQQVDEEQYANLHLTDFLHHMPEAYAVADVVVSRAGALSCSELALTGQASILVPSPNVAGDHQTKNAEAMLQEGAACMVKDDEAKTLLAQLVQTLIQDQDRLKAMQKAALKMARPDAAEVIASSILKIIKNK